MDPNVVSLAQVLQQTYDPAGQKQAEDRLLALQSHSELGVWLLSIVRSHNDAHVRLAAAIQLKNYIGRQWEHAPGEPGTIPEAVRASIKSGLVELVVGAPPLVQAQLREAVSQVAAWDFPGEWPELMPALVARLDAADVNVVNGALVTAHGIMKRWESEVRSDALLMEIGAVLKAFCEPYRVLFARTDALVAQHRGEAAAAPALYQTLFLLTRVFYSLSCQDLPEFFEDHLDEFMGYFLKYLVDENALLVTDSDDEAGVQERLKGAICSVVQLYAKHYEAEFTQLPGFVSAAWQLLTTVGTAPKYDQLACRGLGFLTTIVRLRRHAAHFEADATLRAIVERIVLPNMALRESDEELLEDNPLEFVRRDLEGSDSDTRRRAAADLVRGLLEHFAQRVTAMCSELVGQFLVEYARDPRENWRAKDTALYLITALAARTVAAKTGATRVNEFIEIVPLFSSQILPELQAAADAAAHPVLVVDALKFMTTFRSQLTKAQLLEVLPLVERRLDAAANGQVVYTYASVCVERVLALQSDGRAVFTPDDMKPLAAPLLERLFAILRGFAGRPEKMAENEYLMRAVMRIVVLSQATLLPHAQAMVAQLLGVLEQIIRNPSNPWFNHYTFESLGALVRTACREPGGPGQCAAQLADAFAFILQNDVAEFAPYVFQVYAQILEALRPTDALPPALEQMLPALLQPAVWEPAGNVPPLVRLLAAFLARDAPGIVARQQLAPLLGIFQRLLSRRSQDQYGFELLRAVVERVPMDMLAAHTRNVFLVILGRLSGSRTPKVVQGFASLVCFWALHASLDSDALVAAVDAIQPGLFGQLATGVLAPQICEATSLSDRRLYLLGFAQLVASARSLSAEPYRAAVVPAIVAALLVLAERKMASATAPAAAGDDGGYGADLDDDMSGGYQAVYSRLAMLGRAPVDPTASFGSDERRAFAALLLDAASSQADLGAALQALGPAQLGQLKEYSR